MNLSKCAAFCVLKRFSSGRLCTYNHNLKLSKRFLTVRKFATLSEINKDEATIAEPKSGKHDVFKQLENVRNDHRKKVELLKEIWIQNASTTELSSTFLKAYLQKCIDSSHIDFELDLKEFFEKSGHDEEMLVLLLKYSCYKGNVGNIVKVLGLMKDAGIPADESVFNLIVLGHVVNNGLNGGDLALKTMRAAKIPITENTHWSILKGLCRRKDKKGFSEKLKEIESSFNEEHFYEVLYVLGVYDNHSWMQDFLDFAGKDSIPSTCLKDLVNVCLGLIREEKPEAAYLLYTNLEEVKSDSRFGVDLLEEMVAYKTPIAKVLAITSDLIATEKNSLALFDLTELILRSEDKTDIWRVFSELETLRPHYFWPMFLQSGDKDGERGVFEVLDKMLQFEIKPDYDTLTYYLLGFCDLGNVDDLIERLDVFKGELTMRELFNPMLYQLLSKERVEDAKKFCEKYDLPIFGDRVIKQLSMVWGNTKKADAVVYILRRICETNPQSNDWTGKFMVKCMKLRRPTTDDDKQILALIHLLKKSELKISSLMADYAYATLNGRFKNSELRNEIEAGLDKLLDITKPDSLNTIQHPRDMNLEELECHFIELSNKNMETRGVLRQMINGYSRANNFARVGKLREIFTQSGYEESGGMKASLLNTCIQSRNLTEAKKVYRELKATFPEFLIDSFKLIELANLMVQMGELEEAMDLLRNEKTDIKNMSTIEKNCWRLLNSAKTPTDVQKCLDVLVEKKYCMPTNIILGPLIRSHLKNNDLPGAIDAYVNCTKQHRRTPLQLELMCEVLKTKDDQLLSKVLNATAKVHGVESTRMNLFAALAEQGMEKPLHKLLTEIRKINNNELRKRCDRWVKENKALPLVTVSDSAKRLGSNLVDLDYVRFCIIRVYGAQNDYKAALNFWRQLEKDSTEDISPRLKEELNNLLRRCKVEKELLS